MVQHGGEEPLDVRVVLVPTTGQAIVVEPATLRH
jgi:hypothetical protein